MTRARPFALSLTASLLVSATPALSCACCAEPGERSLYTSSIDDWILEDLGRLRPASTAHLFLTACGFECVSGITNLQDTYTIDPDETLMPLQIGFTDGANGKGAITLQLPFEFEQFSVDVAPDPTVSTPTLFKEWRLQVTATGSGMFSGGLSTDTPAHLIFQGEGNACGQPEDFTHWRLDVKGPSAEFTLFGELDPPL